MINRAETWERPHPAIRAAMLFSLLYGCDICRDGWHLHGAGRQSIPGVMHEHALSFADRG